MLAITIVLFVVPHNQQIVTIRQLFTCRIPMFRNQNLNIQKKWIKPDPQFLHGAQPAAPSAHKLPFSMPESSPH